MEAVGALGTTYDEFSNTNQNRSTSFGGDSMKLPIQKLVEFDDFDVNLGPTYRGWRDQYLSERSFKSTRQLKRELARMMKKEAKR